MRIRLISYTQNGRDTAERIAGVLTGAGHECLRYALPKFLGAGDEVLSVKGPAWAEEGFRDRGPCHRSLGKGQNHRSRSYRNR